MIPLIIVEYCEINTENKRMMSGGGFIIEEKTIYVVAKQDHFSRCNRKRTLVWATFMNRVEGEKARLELDKTV